MDLKCYVYPGWTPRLRAASAKRVWMDKAPESFPYRCLPLNIANSHGWEILSPCGFGVEWNGGPAVDDVIVRPDPGTPAHDAPVALFGVGSFTIHVQGLFRTPPGWNLFVSGPPNVAKDGAAPLTGIIETDWAPYTFTMNWRLTRPNHSVRFERDEPIAHIFLVQRDVIQSVTPRIVPIDEDPELKSAFEAWSRSRDEFQQHTRDNPPKKPADKWQKSYYRGLMPDGRCPISDHQARLNVREFSGGQLPSPKSAAVAPDRPPGQNSPVSVESDWRIAKSEWLFETQERQRALSVRASGIFRVQHLTADQFLDNFYAPGRPVVLCNAFDDWPALGKWTPGYLRDLIGGAEIEYQGAQQSNARYEPDKSAHKRRMPFDQFIDQAVSGAGNDAHLAAYNAGPNAQALAPLAPDLGSIDTILDRAAGQLAGMIWIGSQGTFTPLHHDLTNNLLVQLVGRKRVILASPAETPKLYNSRHVFSDVGNLADPRLDPSTYPKLKTVRTLEVVIGPGEALFIPIGWWRQIESLDFSVMMTYTNFRWPNEGDRDHPVRG